MIFKYSLSQGKKIYSETINNKPTYRHLQEQPMRSIQFCFFISFANREVCRPTLTMVLSAPTLTKFSQGISFMEVSFVIAWKITMAVASVEEFISKNGITVLQKLIQEILSSNGFTICKFWSLHLSQAQLKNKVCIVSSLLKACAILESQKEVQMRGMKWSAAATCKLKFARNPAILISAKGSHFITIKVSFYT